MSRHAFDADTVALLKKHRRKIQNENSRRARQLRPALDALLFLAANEPGKAGRSVDELVLSLDDQDPDGLLADMYDELRNPIIVMRRDDYDQMVSACFACVQEFKNPSQREAAVAKCREVLRNVAPKDIAVLCRCGKKKDKEWHLVCPACWNRIPIALQQEVYAACKEDNNSPRHMVAVRQCIEHLLSLEAE